MHQWKKIHHGLFKFCLEQKSLQNSGEEDGGPLPRECCGKGLEASLWAGLKRQECTAATAWEPSCRHSTYKRVVRQRTTAATGNFCWWSQSPLIAGDSWETHRQPGSAANNDLICLPTAAMRKATSFPNVMNAYWHNLSWSELRQDSGKWSSSVYISMRVTADKLQFSTQGYYLGGFKIYSLLFNTESYYVTLACLELLICRPG